jgi:hypothetical protein
LYAAAENDGGRYLEDLANLRRVARVREHRRSRMEVALVDERRARSRRGRAAVVDENQSSRPMRSGGERPTSAGAGPSTTSFAR